MLLEILRKGNLTHTKSGNCSVIYWSYWQQTEAEIKMIKNKNGHPEGRPTF